MQFRDPSSRSHSEDRATAAILAGGGADGIPALALRYWPPEDGPAMPVFITWVLGVGRFCLTVKYGRYSLKGRVWHIAAGPGLRSTPSPLEQAQVEALRVSRTLQRRLKRGAPVWPALALPDMERDRRVERLARRSGVRLLWDLERYTARLAEGTSGISHGQPPDWSLALSETSALAGDSSPRP